MRLSIASYISLAALLPITHALRFHNEYGSKHGLSMSIFDRKLKVQVPRRDGRSVVLAYFDFWNQRDMSSAIDLFDDNCVYEDTLYPAPFNGKEELQTHLINVANSLPSGFRFVVDAVSEDPVNGNVGVRWHVENGETPLPFSRGTSMYTVDKKTNKIISGFDVPEPTVKAGDAPLTVLRAASGFIEDPNKLIPLAGWIFYCWFLFLSDIAPGNNALNMDPNTLNQVLALSWNFWLVLPIFFPQFDIDTLSPVLEGTFNFLLAYTGLFFGFVVDGKATATALTGAVKETVAGEAKNKFFPVAVMMQFLTNVFYLPYLFTRPSSATSSTASTSSSSSSSSSRSKVSTVIYMEDLSPIEAACESKFLPLVFGAIGMVAIYWGFNGRADVYVDLQSRINSFQSMMSTDRLSFSFLVDIIYFALFQGWLIDDDLARRVSAETEAPIQKNKLELLAKIGKYVPFFGLILYLLGRPALLERKDRLD